MPRWIRFLVTATLLATGLLRPATTASAAASQDTYAPGDCYFDIWAIDAVSTPDGGGCWSVHPDGGVFSFGDARFYGSSGSVHLTAPVVGMASTQDGQGYWLVAADGGVFSFGDAHFYGSSGSVRLNGPVFAIAPTPDGRGYWLPAEDGGVFAFGDAPYLGAPTTLPNTFFEYFLPHGGSLRQPPPCFYPVFLTSGLGYAFVPVVCTSPSHGIS